MATKQERDYVLGTNQEELDRLGLQHRIWQPHVLKCWHEAGITLGSKVLDIGAGPGFASRDLAEIIGQTGQVLAVERSSNFVNYSKQQNELNHPNIKVHELDLMLDEIPQSDFDFTWCRWVACFVPTPEILVEKAAKALKVGGKAIFHEYVNYRSWSLFPYSQPQQEFIEKVVSSWQADGGEPDIALQIPSLLEKHGMKINYTKPHIFTVQPHHYMWNWVTSFVDINLRRMVELGIATEEWTDTVRSEFTQASSNPNSWMMTPCVLEIVAEKL